jgi:hypothetical protein
LPITSQPDQIAASDTPPTKSSSLVVVKDQHGNCVYNSSGISIGYTCYFSELKIPTTVSERAEAMANLASETTPPVSFTNEPSRNLHYNREPLNTTSHSPLIVGRVDTKVNQSPMPLLPVYYVDLPSNTQSQLPVTKDTPYEVLTADLRRISTHIAGQIKPQTGARDDEYFNKIEGPWVGRGVKTRDNTRARWIRSVKGRLQ